MFELTDECETIHAAEGLTIYRDGNMVTRAVFRVDGNGDPLPGCDPHEYGYVLVMLSFVDEREGVMICEVTNLAELLEFSREFAPTA